MWSALAVALWGFLDLRPRRPLAPTLHPTNVTLVALHERRLAGLQTLRWDRKASLVVEEAATSSPSQGPSWQKEALQSPAHPLASGQQVGSGGGGFERSRTFRAKAATTAFSCARPETNWLMSVLLPGFPPAGGTSSTAAASLARSGRGVIPPADSAVT